MTTDRGEASRSPAGRPAGGIDYAALFAAIPTSYLVMSPQAPDYTILDANDLYLANVDRTREEIVGLPVFDAFPPSADTLDADGVPWIRLSFDKAVMTRQPDTMPLQKYDVPSPDGVGMVERHWSLISVPILDEDGEVVLLVQRAENITDFVHERGHGPAPLPDESWRRRVEEVEADLYVRARELAAANVAKEMAARRLAGLADVTRQLATAESLEDLADIVFGAGLPVLGAAGGSIAVRQPGSDILDVTVTSSLGTRMQDVYAQLPLDGPLPTSIGARGLVVLVGNRVEGERYEGLIEAMRLSDTNAWAVLPLQVGAAEPLGSLSVGFREEMNFSKEELELLLAFAAACAQFLDQLQARDAERRAAREVQRISETLQRSLLTDPPVIEGLRFAVAYQPAQQVAQVGGDWYDAFPLRDGATSVVVGDVAGHDQDAAASMAQVRNVLRGVAMTSHAPPAGVLDALDDALDGLGVELLATVVLAQISAADELGARRFTWCNAGHPPPLLCRADGAVAFLDRSPQVLLGLQRDGDRVDHEIELGPGDTVLLYTDGVVEKRGGDIGNDLERLRLHVAAAHLRAVAPSELVRRVLDVALSHDDVALLAVQAL